MANRRDDFNIDRVEEATLYIFCREPFAYETFDAPAEDILNPLTRQIVQAAQDLRLKYKGAPVTVENLSAATGIAIDELDAYGRKATRRQLDDWHTYPRLIRLAAQKRRMVVWLREREESLINTPLLDLPKWNAETHRQFVQNTPDVSQSRPTQAGDIVDQMMGKRPINSQPIPTGISYMDKLTMGGFRPNQIHLIGGATGGGKTITLRQILFNMVFGGARVIHIANDGGSKQEHMAYYVAMRAKWYCIARNYPTQVLGVEGDALHPDNVDIWMNNQHPENEQLELWVPIDPRLEECLLQAVEDYRALRDTGYFALFDAQDLGADIDEVMLLAEREYYQYTATVLAIDHVGTLGDKREMQFFDRFDLNAQLLADLVNRIPIVGLFLAQRTQKGLDKHKTDSGGLDDDTDYLAHIEGGRVWQQVAHTLWLVWRPPGKKYMEIKPKKVRKNEVAYPARSHPLHLPTGLFLPLSEQQAKL